MKPPEQGSPSRRGSCLRGKWRWASDMSSVGSGKSGVLRRGRSSACSGQKVRRCSDFVLEAGGEGGSCELCSTR